MLLGGIRAVGNPLEIELDPFEWTSATLMSSCILFYCLQNQKVIVLRGAARGAVYWLLGVL